ncbi:MAG: hypothetical protein U5L09_05230 [Bacteroidales bacterium]|nr:hypothetical protein [Bacteroidales bacterium]
MGRCKGPGETALVDIHSQNKTMTLNDSDVQLAVIDTVAGEEEMLDSYRKQYQQLDASCRKKYYKVVEQEKQSKADSDYYQYLFNELDEAALDNDEQQNLEEELDIQNHSESIKSTLSHGVYNLSED